MLMMQSFETGCYRYGHRTTDSQQVPLIYFDVKKFACYSLVLNKLTEREPRYVNVLTSYCIKWSLIWSTSKFSRKFSLVFCKALSSIGFILRKKMVVLGDDQWYGDRTVASGLNDGTCWWSAITVASSLNANDAKHLNQMLPLQLPTADRQQGPWMLMVVLVDGIVHGYGHGSFQFIC